MNKAEELFAAVPRMHNCAQAVAAGAGREELTGELSSCGGGRAPGNMCGALYAAVLCCPENCREELRRRFASEMGAENCRVLKNELQRSCPDCVRCAAELLAGFSEKESQNG